MVPILLYLTQQGMSQLKIVNANSGRIHEYENTKRKLYQCYTRIYFNKQCLRKKVIPSYAKMKIPNTSPAAKFTQHKTQFLRIKDELKYLHMKKQQLNTKLYQLHLLLANTWGNTWQYIKRTINGKLEKGTKTIYQTLDHKLHKLTLEQINFPKAHHTFYPRIVNNTDITFSSKETELLEKGPKYNLHNKKKNWLMNLALEA